MVWEKRDGKIVAKKRHIAQIILESVRMSERWYNDNAILWHRERAKEIYAVVKLSNIMKMEDSTIYPFLAWCEMRNLIHQPFTRASFLYHSLCYLSCFICKLTQN